MTAITSRFHYKYEDQLDEFIEASFAVLGAQIDQASKWRPSLPLLTIGAICGAAVASLADTVSGKLTGLLLPIAVAALLTISSKQTRVADLRQRTESMLTKNYNEKNCHIHDLAIDEGGLVEMCPCGTDFRNWEAIKKWHETERVIVLEARNRTYFIIPKRVIPPEDLQPLRELVSRRVVVE